MTEVSNFHRSIATHTASAMGVDRPPMATYWDDGDRNSIFILEASDRPQQGVTSYATVGLSSYPLMKDRSEFPTRVELVGACGSEFKGFSNILATASFCIINSGWFCAPGMIFPGILDMYSISDTMSDVYFASPFLWEKLEKSISLGGKNVAWLLAVPVSKEETEFARRLGSKYLEELFEEENVDIFNLNRPSIV